MLYAFFYTAIEIPDDSSLSFVVHICATVGIDVNWIDVLYCGGGESSA